MVQKTFFSSQNWKKYTYEEQGLWEKGQCDSSYPKIQVGQYIWIVMRFMV